MNLYRNTYIKINLKHISENIKKIIHKFNNYKYYFGVVKADCYGHQDLRTVQTIINSGCNYLVVALLEEALAIRNKFKDIPILCLGVVDVKYLNIIEENNITLSVNSLKYTKELIKSNNSKKIKVHIKINSGMNRLGVSTQEEFNQVMELLNKNQVYIEGIYTHIYNAQSAKDTYEQIDKFKYILKYVKKDSIPIFHIAASETLIRYKKLDFINGCRLGIIMYGFTSFKNLNLQSTYSLYSKIIQINHLKPGDKLGYNGAYVALKDELIGVVCIGYADGIIRKNTGRYVYINEKTYQIVGNICMDMLFVKIDNTIKVNDTVTILKDCKHIEYVADYLETIPYEIICSISKRVPRIYIY